MSLLFITAFPYSLSNIQTYLLLFLLFAEATDGALQMFTDGVDEFFKCLMDSINTLLINEDQDKNVSL